MLNILGELIAKIFWFALHIEEKNNFPKPISAAEERELFQKLANGDIDAKNRLILHNLRLVAHIAKKYPAAEQDELISIGTIGLIKAVSTFSAEKGNRFATYGSRCIENEILMHFRSCKKTSLDIHFDEPIDVDKDGNKLTLMDIVAEDRDIYSEVDLKINSGRLYQGIAEILSDRERKILTLRYGLFNQKPLTQKETAKVLQISRSYVSRIEKRAIDKLKEYFGDA